MVFVVSCLGVLNVGWPPSFSYPFKKKLGSIDADSAILLVRRKGYDGNLCGGVFVL